MNQYIDRIKELLTQMSDIHPSGDWSSPQEYLELKDKLHLGLAMYMDRYPTHNLLFEIDKMEIKDFLKTMYINRIEAKI